MANVTFYKGKCTADTTYVAGGIYFDTATRELRLGVDGTTAYTAYGNGIKDVVLDGTEFTVSFHDTDRKSIVLDFGDIASATDMTLKFDAIKTALAGKVDAVTGADAIVVDTPDGDTKTATVSLKLDNTGNVKFEQGSDGLKATVETVTPKAGTDISIGTEGDAKDSINVALSKDITVAGLNDTYGCGLIKNGNTIKAGTSLTDILAMMLSKEVQPAESTKPSISITKSGAVSGLHEVGEKVSVGTASIAKSAGNFNNNEWATPAQPVAAFTWSGEKMSSKLTAGATGYTAQTDVTSIAQGTATTVKGTNTVSITASAAYSAPTNKPITNLGNDSNEEKATWTASTATASAKVSWTGVYPVYTNSAKLGTDTFAKLPLAEGPTFTLPVASHNDNDFRFAYPDGWTISSFKVKSLDGKYYDFAAHHDKNAGDVTMSIQGNDVTYHYLSVKNGESDYQITLSKKLSA